MNTKQLSTWKQLVQQCETQCKRQPYSSINVSSVTRSEAIVAAAELVELVTPETATLLEQLARYANYYDAPASAYDARALAARIREVLDDDQT